MAKPSDYVAMVDADLQVLQAGPIQPLDAVCRQQVAVGRIVLGRQRVLVLRRDVRVALDALGVGVRR